ncbi:IDEAL domain-containing protein [Virgibacillus sp. NKC19-16]|uniref:IDEAL domain-containing protein n=1 Tax=Virgibacillus salidurans TaxID=2831673 RepID=UPI001F34A99D|nr:IDEAL domain-containing protein [Virgibacillus sp. NKC19-16]UJL45367.1 IDEAL domain-containing protein [Virgibacillus sp. NKC19-16]
MVTVNMLKPYYIKAEVDYVRVILAYQYFSVLINQKVYQFIPVEAKEIRINRRTRKVENVEAKFAFQKGKEVVYMTISELILLPDFVNQLHSIAEPYYISENTTDRINESAIMIRELENENVKRLIDKALDERDEEAFNTLVRYL